MNFHPQSSIWIYQSNRSFNESEIKGLQQILTDFTQTWTAHNNLLKAGFEIKYNRFIILIVDETQTGASGCSIDKSVHLMKEIEKKFDVKLFDRLQIAYKEGNEVKVIDQSAFAEKIAEGIINTDSIVFNNLVKNYETYKTAWESRLKNSWHARVFSKNFT